MQQQQKLLLALNSLIVVIVIIQSSCVPASKQLCFRCYVLLRDRDAHQRAQFNYTTTTRFCNCPWPSHSVHPFIHSCAHRLTGTGWSIRSLIKLINYYQRAMVGSEEREQPSANCTHVTSRNLWPRKLYGSGLLHAMAFCLHVLIQVGFWICGHSALEGCS